ncbi:TetR/AcrR family transcriptional regulator [Nonomuraea antimicrobica]
MIPQLSDTGERIRTAAVLLFARQGYAATSIRDLGRAVGMTNAGIYHHVASKEALLADLMRVAQQGLIEATRRLLAPCARPADRLALLISSLTAVHALSPMTTRVMDGELRSLTPAPPPTTRSSRCATRTRPTGSRRWPTASPRARSASPTRSSPGSP